MKAISSLPASVRQYLLITTNYWFFTLTDGALRMLVVLHFHQLGYQPLAIAMLFLFYEVFGVITNFVGGWLGARLGLNKIMNIGLFMQVFALMMLTVPVEYLTIFWVMTAQALSGIAKDLNKMSAKSSIKLLVPEEAKSTLFRWVALLTGSKNALKGLGFFLGALLLNTIGFKAALVSMAAVLLAIALISVLHLKNDLGKSKFKVKFSQMFSPSPELNYLSAARLFLFAARDVWFVIALPVYLSENLHWSQTNVGAFIALWIIAYGVVQAVVPKFVTKKSALLPSANLLSRWGLLLAFVTLFIPFLMALPVSKSIIIVISLLSFGFIFATNSSLHSYAIVALSKRDGVSMDVGFYYMANAMGRLLGTVLSGWIFQLYNLEVCLLLSAIFALLAAIFIRKVEL